MKVDVYRNLHKKCMSVRSRERQDYGKVVTHASFIRMLDCRFIVNPAGRAKVLKFKKKNVHAFVRGTLLRSLGRTFCGMEPKIPDAEVDDWTEVIYNPYYYDSFVINDGDYTQSVLGAEEVLIANNKVYAKGLNLGV